ncbi:MAG TPA: hypothetical protein DF699_02255, partial [Phycisphaerales bacterium]|nr:hypothetical protein [Phycisphaerales bacterium]
MQQIAHIYYNVASGERVVTVLSDSQTSGSDSGYNYKQPLWAVESGPPCESAGYTSSFYFAVDDPTNTSMGGASPLATQITVLDMGDIAVDTVVDCVQVHWVVAHTDTDSDSDSVGDGVEELAGQWIIWDADNGRPNCHRLPLVDFTFYNLPGNIAGPDSQSAYTLDVDLVADFSSSDLTFEIGDSDGDCQSAAFCNSSVFDSATGTYLPVAQCDNNFDSLPDSDIDGDGLFDFSWTVRFYQPGIGNDFDSDSDTGSAAPSSSDSIGINFGFPEGS